MALAPGGHEGCGQSGLFLRRNNALGEQDIAVEAALAGLHDGVGGLRRRIEGMALHEETLIDHAFGRIMNANIAEYHVPVNADVHDIKVIFVDEADDSNPLGIKGVGEVGICGAGAAVANAIYNACGARVRDYPITLDKILPELMRREG